MAENNEWDVEGAKFKRSEEICKALSSQARTRKQKALVQSIFSNIGILAVMGDDEELANTAQARLALLIKAGIAIDRDTPFKNYLQQLQDHIFQKKPYQRLKGRPAKAAKAVKPPQKNISEAVQEGTLENKDIQEAEVDLKRAIEIFASLKIQAETVEQKDLVQNLLKGLKILGKAGENKGMISETETLLVQLTAIGIASISDASFKKTLQELQELLLLKKPNKKSKDQPAKEVSSPKRKASATLENKDIQEAGVDLKRASELCETLAFHAETKAQKKLVFDIFVDVKLLENAGRNKGIINIAETNLAKLIEAGIASNSDPLFISHLQGLQDHLFLKKPNKELQNRPAKEVSPPKRKVSATLENKDISELYRKINTFLDLGATPDQKSLVSALGEKLLELQAAGNNVELKKVAETEVNNLMGSISDSFKGTVLETILQKPLQDLQVLLFPQEAKATKALDEELKPEVTPPVKVKRQRSIGYVKAGGKKTLETDIDFKPGMKLDESAVSRVHISNKDLSGSSARKGVFDNVLMKFTSFEGSDMPEVNFSFVKGQYSNMSNINAPGIRFLNSDFSCADFHGSNLEGLTVQGECDFRGANFTRTILPKDFDIEQVNPAELIEKLDDAGTTSAYSELAKHLSPEMPVERELLIYAIGGKLLKMHALRKHPEMLNATKLEIKNLITSNLRAYIGTPLENSLYELQDNLFPEEAEARQAKEVKKQQDKDARSTPAIAHMVRGGKQVKINFDALPENRNIERVNFSRYDISDKDLSSLNIEGGDFSGAICAGTNFQDSNLQGIKTDETSDFRGANFVGTTLPKDFDVELANPLTLIQDTKDPELANDYAILSKNITSESPAQQRALLYAMGGKLIKMHACKNAPDQYKSATQEIREFYQSNVRLIKEGPLKTPLTALHDLLVDNDTFQKEQEALQQTKEASRAAKQAKKDADSTPAVGHMVRDGEQVKINIDGAQETINLTRANFTGLDLSHKEFPSLVLSLSDFRGTKCAGTNFQGSNLSEIKYDEETDFRGANLLEAEFDFDINLVDPEDLINEGDDVYIQKLFGTLADGMESDSHPPTREQRLMVYAIGGKLLKMDEVSHSDKLISETREEIRTFIVDCFTKNYQLDSLGEYDPKFKSAIDRFYSHLTTPPIGHLMRDGKKVLLYVGTLSAMESLDGANLSGSDLQLRKLTELNLDNAIMTGANTQHSSFAKSTMRGTHLEAMKGDFCNMREVDAEGAHFEGAQYFGADFQGANLIGISDDQNTSFEGANFLEAKVDYDFDLQRLNPTAYIADLKNPAIEKLYSHLETAISNEEGIPRSGITRNQRLFTYAIGGKLVSMSMNQDNEERFNELRDEIKLFIEDTSSKGLLAPDPGSEGTRFSDALKTFQAEAFPEVIKAKNPANLVIRTHSDEVKQLYVPLNKYTVSAEATIQQVSLVYDIGSKLVEIHEAGDDAIVRAQMKSDILDLITSNSTIINGTPLEGLLRTFKEADAFKKSAATPAIGHMIRDGKRILLTLDSLPQDKNLERANFSGSKVNGITLQEYNLDECTMTGTKMRFSNWRKSTVRRGHLEKVKGEFSSMRYLDAEGAHIEGANFIGTDFQYGKFKGIRMNEDTNVRGANFLEAEFDFPPELINPALLIRDLKDPHLRELYSQLEAGIRGPQAAGEAVPLNQRLFTYAIGGKLLKMSVARNNEKRANETMEEIKFLVKDSWEKGLLSDAKNHQGPKFIDSVKSFDILLKAPRRPLDELPEIPKGERESRQQVELPDDHPAHDLESQVEVKAKATQQLLQNVAKLVSKLFRLKKPAQEPEKEAPRQEEEQRREVDSDTTPRR